MSIFVYKRQFILTLFVAVLYSMGTVYAQKAEVESYDLRGRAYNQDQIGVTAKAYSKDKVVLVAHVNKSNTSYEQKVLDVVLSHMRDGQTEILVLFVGRNKGSRNAVHFFAEGKLIVSVYGDASDYGLSITQTLQKVYSEYIN